MLVGPALYEWLSHNLFDIAMIAAVIIALIYAGFTISRKKGRYRQ
ncbi:hypothetical protein T458_13240 [Brevibacillus panacihumi W25]|uniref:Uncharacterized protein n=1 Tax=Brevibacillus panacihumi W25 TaxID=1408254 RepID=V6M8U6_9BACL|nr:EYxxD motif small membrane protein [Brevibacillus panacihumi]EST54300.1 hypothetical protein T458_13240 [Brevibacillus panacihumi W25]